MAADCKGEAKKLELLRNSRDERIRLVKSEKNFVSALSDQLKDFAKKNHKTYNLIAKTFSRASDFVDHRLSRPLSQLGAIFGYAASLGKELHEQAVVIAENLKMLDDDMQTCCTLFQKYSLDQKSVSQLAELVEQTIMDVEKWKEQIDNKDNPIKPEALVKELERRRHYVEKALAVEALRWDVQIFDSLVSVHEKIDEVKTLLLDADEEYEKGKFEMAKKAYPAAMRHFKRFRDLVSQGQRTTRIGSKDNSGAYLCRCWEEQKVEVELGRAPSLSGTEATNPWIAFKDELKDQADHFYATGVKKFEADDYDTAIVYFNAYRRLVKCEFPTKKTPEEDQSGPYLYICWEKRNKKRADRLLTKSSEKNPYLMFKDRYEECRGVEKTEKTEGGNIKQTNRRKREDENEPKSTLETQTQKQIKHH